MRRAVRLALLLLAACSRLPEGQRRELVEHWPSRAGRSPVVRARGQEVVSAGKWVKDGEFVFFDERGREISRGAYRAGLEHGPWTEIEPDGDVGRGAFREGRREGKWTWSHPDGTPQEEGAYVDGLRHGYWLRWHASGKKAAELMYERGKLNGTCRYFDETGKEEVLRSGRYEGGERVD